MSQPPLLVTPLLTPLRTLAVDSCWFHATFMNTLSPGWCFVRAMACAAQPALPALLPFWAPIRCAVLCCSRLWPAQICVTGPGARPGSVFIYSIGPSLSLSPRSRSISCCYCWQQCALCLHPFVVLPPQKKRKKMMHATADFLSYLLSLSLSLWLCLSPSLSTFSSCVWAFSLLIEI